jgi:hypothetical protein
MRLQPQIHDYRPQDYITCKGTQTQYSRTPLIRKLVIRNANNPDRLGPSGKFIENSKKSTCLEITGYRIKFSTVLWLLELQIRRGSRRYILYLLTAELKTANVAFFQRKIQLFGFSAHPDGSPSQSIRIIGVLLYSSAARTPAATDSRGNAQKNICSAVAEFRKLRRS